jgi:hypothetical protein
MKTSPHLILDPKSNPGLVISKTTTVMAQELVETTRMMSPPLPTALKMTTLPATVATATETATATAETVDTAQKTSESAKKNLLRRLRPLLSSSLANSHPAHKSLSLLLLPDAPSSETSFPTSEKVFKTLCRLSSTKPST